MLPELSPSNVAIIYSFQQAKFALTFYGCKSLTLLYFKDISATEFDIYKEEICKYCA